MYVAQSGLSASFVRVYPRLSGKRNRRLFRLLKQT